MLFTRSAMRRYLDLVRPWCANSWTHEKINSPEFIQDHSDPARIIFLIPERALPGFMEQALLGDDASRALMILLAWVGRFNDMANSFNASSMDSPLLRQTIAAMTHGVIGAPGDGHLHDAFLLAEESVS